MKKRVAKNKTWIAAALLLVFASALAFIIWNRDSPVSLPPDGNDTTKEAKIEGEAICLPHKDTSGPQTLECAFGVRLDNGTYYALRDGDDSYKHVSGLQMGERYQFTGSLKKEPSDRYQSTGVFTIHSVGIID